MLKGDPCLGLIPGDVFPHGKEFVQFSEYSFI